MLSEPFDIRACDSNESFGTLERIPINPASALGPYIADCGPLNISICPKS